MTSIGDTLRRERLKQKLEVSTIAGELKISSRFLVAIEADDLSKLPGGVFTKSFIRQYAAFLGLNAEELVSEVRRLVEPEPEAVPFEEKPKPDVPGIDMRAPDPWQSIGHENHPWPSWVKAGALLVLLMVVCSGLYWWWERSRHQALAIETPPANRTLPVAQTAPTPPPVNSPAPTDTGLSPASDAPPASSAPPAQTAAATPPSDERPRESNPNAKVRVGITADEQVWVSAVVNGKVQFTGLLQPHETRTIDADGEVKLRLGNAGGASMTLNGKPVGSVGPKGQVRTVQFTSGGFQIVSPPKSLEPLERL